MVASRRMLGAALVYPVLCAIGALSGLGGLVFGLVCVPFVTFMPGLALLWALEGPSPRFDSSTRAVAAVGTSLAVAVLLGILLNALGLTRTSWAVSIAALTAGGMLVAIRRATPPGSPRSSRLEPLRRTGIIGWLVGCVSVGLLVGSIVLTQVSAHANFDKPVVQLWGSSAPNGDEHTIFVRNLSNQNRRLRLDVRNRWGLRTINFTLPPGGQRSRAFKTAPGTNQVTLSTASGSGAEQLSWDG